jgi:hypothetical protein
MTEIWPNFFIVGAPKSGTTLLYNYLKQHPKVFLSSRKEPHFFSQSYHNFRLAPPVTTKNLYLEIFENADNFTAVGEASTNYLSDPEAAYLIKNQLPNSKIIISLRNPIDRAFSDYLFNINIGFEKQSFQKSIKKLSKNYDPVLSPRYLHAGLYYQHLQRYFELFGREQVKIIIFEEWIQKPLETIHEILEFLEISEPLTNYDDPNHYSFEDVKNIIGIKSEPKNHISKYILEHQSVFNFFKLFFPLKNDEYIKNQILLKNSTKPKLKENDKIFLKNYFTEDVKQLEFLLKRELPWKEFYF